MAPPAMSNFSNEKNEMNINTANIWHHCSVSLNIPIARSCLLPQLPHVLIALLPE
jgi:hypothetical protein